MQVQRRIQRQRRTHWVRGPWLGSLLTLCFASALGAPAGNTAPGSGAGQAVPPAVSPDVLERARRFLDAQMPVSASSLLARELGAGELDGDEAVLLAARALTDQRAWSSVRALLSGREGSTTAARARTALLLARAYAGLDSVTRSAAHFRAYLGAVEGTPPLSARVEFARVSNRRYHWYEARDQFALAEREHPDLAPWLRLSRLYALAEAEDRAAFALADSIAGGTRVPADSALLPAARLAFELGEDARGAALAQRAGRGVRNVLAARHLGPHYLATGDTAAATDAFAAAIARGLQTPETGPTLLALTRTWRTLRDVGRSDTRAGRRSRGAGYLAQALELAPETERPGIAESLASAYMAMGAPGRAAETLAPWTADPASVTAPRASLWMLASSVYRALDRPAAAAEAQATAARGSGDVAARAAYLIADLEHDAGRPEAAASGFERSYRAFPDASYGSRSLERLALLAYHEGRHDDARGLLGEYRQRYPEGEWTQGAIYWSGKVAEALGDERAASAFYARALRYNPLDYYAILAEPRTGTNRLASIRLGEAEPLPALDPIHAAALRRMNKLREVGWPERARREYRRASERGPATYGAILAFAHALNDAQWTREGIREGWRAQAIGGRWTRPLLEAIYPLPFREALVEAAERRGLSPHFVAGLARRESMFDPDIRSVANAIGLMQLLPETARSIASRAGLPDYGRHQLTVPQVNLMLGTQYLSDVLGRFDGFDIAGMISYNAGPHRYARWRDFPEFSDQETLVERIPYRETREYVRAVTELAEIYRFLYPDPAAANP